MQEKKEIKLEVKERIKLYLIYRDMTYEEFYVASFVSRGILSQSNGISEENIMRFLDFAPDVNPEWLLTGKGDMLKKNVKAYKNKTLPERISQDGPTGYSTTENLVYKGLFEEQKEEIKALHIELGRQKCINENQEKEIAYLKSLLPDNNI